MNQARTRHEHEDLLLLEGLEEAARALGLRVRVERGSFRSGRCRSKGEELVILNRRLSTRERAQVLARILSGEDLEQAFLKPAVRAFIQAGGERAEAAMAPSSEPESSP